MIVPSPRKNGTRATPSGSPDKQDRRARHETTVAPDFAAKTAAAPTGTGAGKPSSSSAFSTSSHPLKPFNVTTTAVLPIILPPATLRPLAFRTFTKKHGLTLTSPALQELASFIGRHCGSAWRERGLAEKVLEEAARSWKNRNGGVIVDGSSIELKDILRTIEGSMSGGSIMSGGLGLSRQNSLILDPAQNTSHAHTLLGLRPADALRREDSQSSMGLSSLAVGEDPEGGDDGPALDVRSWIRVVGAFEQPRLVYHVEKKHFETDPATPSLFPAASRKTNVFRNRFNVIHQRLLRNETFQRSAVVDARAVPSLKRSSYAAQPSHKITPIANLLGRHGSHHMLLGMLLILPTGNLAISDLTASIALDVQQAVAIPEDSAWFTPGMIVLVDGVYEEEEESVGRGLGGHGGVGGTIGGRFQAFFMGQPPCEKRRTTLGVSDADGGRDHAIGGGFGWIDFLGVGSERAVGSRMRRLEERLLRRPATAEADSPHRGRVVVLGELNLDEPTSLQALGKILGLYTAEPEGAEPLAFILTGNFTSDAAMARGAAGGSIEYKEYFDALASVLSEYPALLTSATFVFVPGDNDGWESAFGGGAAVPLPRKPVPELFTSRVRRTFATANAEAGLAPGEGRGGVAIWTTNPSRLSIFGPQHEIVLFRDDMSARLRRTAVRLNTNVRSVNVEESSTTMDLDPDSPPSFDNSLNGAASAAQEGKVSHDVRTARKLVKTVLDQGYLAPFRQQIRPVHWDFASALHLYPLPTVVILVDTGAPAFCITYEGCHAMNPGRFLAKGRKGVARWIEYDIGKTGRVRECLF